MSILLRLLVAVGSALVAPHTITSWPPDVPDAGVDSTLFVAELERLVFVVPLGSFIATAASTTHDERFDWSSDGCSAPLVGGTGRSFDFTASCRRHDFAYRNFRRIDGGILWTPPLRKRIDTNFLRDMQGQCSHRRRYDRPTCRLWAIVFYRSVRLCAGP